MKARRYYWWCKMLNGGWTVKMYTNDQAYEYFINTGLDVYPVTAYPSLYNPVM